MPARELIDLTVHVHHFTYHADGKSRRAVLVSDDADSESAVWLPCSQIEIDEDAAMNAATVIVCPVWLAKDKGLV